jgi:hypothetical protein
VLAEPRHRLIAATVLLFCEGGYASCSFNQSAISGRYL